jgi:DNA-binding transcriptional LysR family regulator
MTTDRVLNYNHLHYFHVAANAGSLAAAAVELGVKQPTVSEQLRALERALEVSLFERLPTGLRLTDAGRLVFEQTTVMFRAGERLVESLGKQPQRLPRSFRVGMSSAVARATTTDFVMPLLAVADCVPSIRTGDAMELQREMRGNELDLLLCESEPPEGSRHTLIVVMIQRTRLVVVAPPTLALEGDWQAASLVQYRATSSYRWDVEAFLDAHGYRPSIAAEADDALFMVEAAARGGHIAIVPRSVTADAIAAGRLRVVAHVDAGDRAGVYAVYPDNENAQLARRVVEALLERANAAGADDPP